MKITPLNNLLFGKKHIATCAVKTAQGNMPCKIYQLEHGDEQYFENVYENPGWKNKQDYILSVDYDINNGYIESTYVLEDKKNNCLGYVEACDAGDNRMVLEFIEVKPVCRKKNSERKKEYIGETLINFVAQLAKRMKKDTIHVIYPTRTALGFYDKCGFVKGDDNIDLKFNLKNIDKLQKQNYEHTGSLINFEG